MLCLHLSDFVASSYELDALNELFIVLSVLESFIRFYSLLESVPSQVASQHDLTHSQLNDPISFALFTFVFFKDLLGPF